MLIVVIVIRRVSISMNLFPSCFACVTDNLLINRMDAYNVMFFEIHARAERTTKSWNGCCPNGLCGLGFAKASLDVCFTNRPLCFFEASVCQLRLSVGLSTAVFFVPSLGLRDSRRNSY